MRRLTFKGYLESYLPYLAGEDTLALSHLARLLPEEPRLVAPLLLWAAVSGKADRLSRLLDNDETRSDLELLVALHHGSRLETALATEDSNLRPEYSKVWRSFAARRDAPERDADLKLRARARVLALAQEKKVTRYRMARDLGLNDGNLHAFLTQGNVSKLSLKRAFELVKYLEAA